LEVDILGKASFVNGTLESVLFYIYMYIGWKETRFCCGLFISIFAAVLMSFKAAFVGGSV